MFKMSINEKGPWTVCRKFYLTLTTWGLVQLGSKRDESPHGPIRKGADMSNHFSLMHRFEHLPKQIISHNP
jgi:hypothetical protein